MTNHVTEEQRHCFLPTLKDGSVYYSYAIDGQNEYHWIRGSEQTCTVLNNHDGGKILRGKITYVSWVIPTVAVL